MNKDNINYDYQTILIKKDKLDEILNNYKCFGWDILQTKQSTRYENILEITLQRSHFINNKDDLQYLQVNMEAQVNKNGKLEKQKHSKSTITGVSFGVLAAIGICSAVFCFLDNSDLFFFIMGIVFCLLSACVIIMLPIIVVKLVKSENIIFKKLKNEYEQSIANYCEKAKILVGAKDEK